MCSMSINRSDSIASLRIWRNYKNFDVSNSKYWRHIVRTKQIANAIALLLQKIINVLSKHTPLQEQKLSSILFQESPTLYYKSTIKDPLKAFAKSAHNIKCNTSYRLSSETTSNKRPGFGANINVGSSRGKNTRSANGIFSELIF